MNPDPKLLGAALFSVNSEVRMSLDAEPVKIDI